MSVSMRSLTLHILLDCMTLKSQLNWASFLRSRPFPLRAPRKGHRNGIISVPSI